MSINYNLEANFGENASKDSTPTFDVMSLYRDLKCLQPTTQEVAKPPEGPVKAEFINYAADDRRVVQPNDFDTIMPKEAADRLRSLNCKSVECPPGGEGHYKFSFDAAQTVGTPGVRFLNGVKLDQQVELDIKKNGGDIEVSNVKGVHIDSSLSIWDIDVPSFKVTQNDQLDLGKAIPNFTVPGLYGSLNSMLNK